MRSTVLLGVLLMLAVNAPAQEPAPQQPETDEPIATFKVDVVARTAKAINYRHRGGATKVYYKGTSLLPDAHGQAKVESKKGYIEIEVEFRNLKPASLLGPEYLTYVMWAITPEGRSTNLGEVLLDEWGRGKINVTTELQAFGMVVTAEPYFAVTIPSDKVVMENEIGADTRGKVQEINARYELLQEGSYLKDIDRSALAPVKFDGRTPLELHQARNAVQIAGFAEASRYAAASFEKAQKLLAQAEDYHKRKQKKPSIMIAREAVQTAEDARMIAVRREAEERLAEERRIAAERQAEARARAEEEARLRALAEAEQRAEAERRARAEADSLAAEKARLAAEQARLIAELEAERAAREKAEADAARYAALQQQEAMREAAERARMAAEEAERQRRQAEAEKEALRRRLLEQFNSILQTRDSERGLVVQMSDVLFDTAQYALRPLAREKLARISGIVLAYPGLQLEIEGHTDSIGSDEYNLVLSERRAASVRDYLVQQGLPADLIVVRGLGKTEPVADNSTAAGRQLNRRVELIVSGEVIGVSLTSSRMSQREALPLTQ